MWPVILIIGITVAAIVFFASSRFTDRFIGRIGAALTLGSLVAALFVFIFPAAQSVSAPTLTSTNSLYADGVRGDILAATDTAIIKTKVDNIWTEAASGLQPTNKYDPSGCPNLDYGLAWNMRYNGRDYINTVIAFSTRNS